MVVSLAMLLQLIVIEANKDSRTLNNTLNEYVDKENTLYTERFESVRQRSMLLLSSVMQLASMVARASRILTALHDLTKIDF